MDAQLHAEKDREELSRANQRITDHANYIKVLQEELRKHGVIGKLDRRREEKEREEKVPVLPTSTGDTTQEQPPSSSSRPPAPPTQQQVDETNITQNPPSQAHPQPSASVSTIWPNIGLSSIAPGSELQSSFNWQFHPSQQLTGAQQPGWPYPMNPSQLDVSQAHFTRAPISRLNPSFPHVMYQMTAMMGHDPRNTEFNPVESSLSQDWSQLDATIQQVYRQGVYQPFPMAPIMQTPLQSMMTPMTGGVYGIGATSLLGSPLQPTPRYPMTPAHPPRNTGPGGGGPPGPPQGPSGSGPPSGPAPPPPPPPGRGPTAPDVSPHHPSRSPTGNEPLDINRIQEQRRHQLKIMFDRVSLDKVRLAPKLEVDEDFYSWRQLTVNYFSALGCNEILNGIIRYHQLAETQAQMDALMTSSAVIGFDDNPYHAVDRELEHDRLVFADMSLRMAVSKKTSVAAILGGIPSPNPHRIMARIIDLLNPQNPQTRQLLFNKLDTMVQLPSESIQAFSTRVQLAISNAVSAGVMVSQEQQVNIFIRGLKRLPDYRRDMIIRDPKYRTISAIANELTNLEQVDAVKYAGQAIRQQAMKERSTTSAHTAISSTASKGIKCYNCQEYGHRKSECTKPRKEREAADGSGQSTPFRKNASTPKKAKAGRKTTKGVYCDWCLIPNHTINVCKKKARGENPHPNSTYAKKAFSAEATDEDEDEADQVSQESQDEDESSVVSDYDHDEEEVEESDYDDDDGLRHTPSAFFTECVRQRRGKAHHAESKQNDDPINLKTGEARIFRLRCHRHYDGRSAPSDQTL